MNTTPENESHGASAFDAAAEMARKELINRGNEAVDSTKTWVVEQLKTAPVEAAISAATFFRNDAMLQNWWKGVLEDGRENDVLGVTDGVVDTAAYYGLRATPACVALLPVDLRASFLTVLVLTGGVPASDELISKIENQSSLKETIAIYGSKVLGYVGKFTGQAEITAIAKGVELIALGKGKGRELAKAIRARVEGNVQKEPDATLHEKHDEEMNIVEGMPNADVKPEGMPAQANTNEGFEQEEAA